MENLDKILNKTPEKPIWNFSLTNEDFTELKEKGKVVTKVEDKKTLDTELGETINMVDKSGKEEEKLIAELVSIEDADNDSVLCTFVLVEK